jgi:hypothetical protein
MDMFTPGREVDNLFLMTSENGVYSTRQQHRHVGERSKTTVGYHDIATFKRPMDSSDQSHVMAMQSGRKRLK